MKLLEERIRRDGKVYAGDVLKVDSFLNHQIDVDFLGLLGEEFHRLFSDCDVNKILTVEASGIGIACIAAQFFHCPVLFAKKSKTSNIGNDVWAATAHSYTHGNDNTLVVSKAYQKGGALLRGKGFRVEALARVASMDPEKGITFAPPPYGRF